MTNTYSVLAELKLAREQAQSELDTILNRYSGGGMYSSDDSSAEDYVEGKLVAYDHAIDALTRVPNTNKGATP